MPYIKPKDRTLVRVTKEARPMIDITEACGSPGFLNFAISSLVSSYMQINGPVNYKLLNELIGVLECAKQEFYGTMCRQYEDVKIEENGPVYPFSLTYNPTSKES